MTTYLHSTPETREIGVRFPSWSKKTIFTRLNPRQQWHENIANTAGSYRPSDPLFPWDCLRKHTDHYLKRKGKMAPAKKESKLAALIEEHEPKDVAIAACVHVMPPSSLRALLNVELCVAPVSYLGLDTYLQSLVAVNFYSTHASKVLETQCAKHLVPYVIRGTAAAGRYLEGICTLLQTIEITNMDSLAAFEMLTRRAVRDFALQLQGMRLRYDWVTAYSAVAWMQRLVSEPHSKKPTNPLRLTPDILLNGQYPCWKIWAFWKPNLARLSLMQDAEHEKRSVLVDHMALEGPDFFTGTEKCLRDGMILVYQGSEKLVRFKSLLIELQSCSKEEFAQIMNRLAKSLDLALENGRVSFDIFLELGIKRPVSKREVQLLEALSKIEATPGWHIHKAALDVYLNHEKYLGSNHISSLQHVIHAMDDPSGQELADVFSLPQLISGIEGCIAECKLAMRTLMSNGQSWTHRLQGFHTFCTIVKDSRSWFPRMCAATKAQLEMLPTKEELRAMEEIYKVAVQKEEYEAGLPLGIGSPIIKGLIEDWCIERFMERGTMSALSQVTVESILKLWQSTRDKKEASLERRSLVMLASKVVEFDQELQYMCLQPTTRFSEDFVSRLLVVLRHYFTSEDNLETSQSRSQLQAESCIRLTRLLVITKEEEAVQCWKRVLRKWVEALPHDSLLDVSLEKLSADGWTSFMLDLESLCKDAVTTPESSLPSVIRADWAREISEFIPTLVRLEEMLRDRTAVKFILRGDADVKVSHTFDILMNLTWAINTPAESLMQQITGLLSRQCKHMENIANCLESLMIATPEGLDACGRIWDIGCKKSSSQDVLMVDPLSTAAPNSASSFHSAVTNLSDKVPSGQPLLIPGLDISVEDEEMDVMEVMVAGWLQDDEMSDNDKAAIEALANVLDLVCYKSQIPEHKLEVARRFWEDEEAKMFEDLTKLIGITGALKAKDPIGTRNLLAELGIPDINLLDEEIARLPIEISGALERCSENEIEMNFSLESYTLLKRMSLGLGEVKTLSVRLFLDSTDEAPPAYCVHLDTDHEPGMENQEHTPWVCLRGSEEPIQRYCRGSVNPFTWQLSRTLHRTFMGKRPSLAELYKIIETHVEEPTKFCPVCGKVLTSYYSKYARSQPCDSDTCARTWSKTNINVRIPELQDTFAADLIISAVYAAAHTGRIALLPGCPVTNTVKIKALLNWLPPLYRFANDPSLSRSFSLHYKELEPLLIWAFTHYSGFLASAKGLLKVPSMPMGTLQFVLASASPAKEASFASRMRDPTTYLINPQPDILWHGTAIDRLPCILNEGLRALSGTELQRNGAMHGDGIYLADHPSVSLAYSPPPAVKWGNSRLDGMKLLLGCEVLACVGTRTSGIHIVVDAQNVMVRYLFLVPNDAHGPVANHVVPAMRSAINAMKNGTV